MRYSHIHFLAWRQVTEDVVHPPNFGQHNGKTQGVSRREDQHLHLRR